MVHAENQEKIDPGSCQGVHPLIASVKIYTKFWHILSRIQAEWRRVLPGPLQSIEIILFCIRNDEFQNFLGNLLFFQ